MADENADNTAATPTDAPAVVRPDDAEADSYEAIEAEVDKHFSGSWENFLKAVSNAKEVLHFVLVRHCDTDPNKFQAWAAEKQLPETWVQRFYMTLTPEGDLRS